MPPKKKKLADTEMFHLSHVQAKSPSRKWLEDHDGTFGLDKSESRSRDRDQSQDLWYAMAIMPPDNFHPTAKQFFGFGSNQRKAFLQLRSRVESAGYLSWKTNPKYNPLIRGKKRK